MRRNSIFIIFFILVMEVSAQPLINITNFSNSIIYYNPAYAGTHQGINSSLVYRSQWTGLPGRPNFSAFSISMPFNYERLGIGLTIFRSLAGAERNFSVHGNFSYKINFKKGRMAFGLKAGAVQVTEDMGLLKVKDPDDPYIGYTKLFTEAGGGIFYYSKKYFGGLSFTRTAALYKAPDLSLKNYYYLITGIKNRLTEDILFFPSALVQYTQQFPLQISVTLPIEYRNIFWIGAMYRSPSVISFMGGVYLNKVVESINNSLQVCYAYDRSLGKRYSPLGSTHEIMLLYNFDKGQSIENIMKRRVTVSPLYFD